MGRCVHEADEKWGGESKGADEKWGGESVTPEPKQGLVQGAEVGVQQVNCSNCFHLHYAYI